MTFHIYTNDDGGNLIWRGDPHLINQKVDTVVRCLIFVVPITGHYTNESLYLLQINVFINCN